MTVAPDDENAILGALRDVAAGRHARHYEPRGLRPYVFPAPAEAVAAEVERAIARR